MNINDVENVVMLPQNKETYINRQIVNRSTVFPNERNCMSPEVEQISIRPYAMYLAQCPINNFNSSPLTEEQQNHMNKLIWVDDYTEDIYQTLRQAELRRRALSFSTTQYSSRSTLLKILLDARDKYNLTRPTLHLAVYYMDHFLDEFTVRSDRIILTALVCILLAAKMEENDANTPRFSHLNRLTNDAFKLADYQRFEIKVLETFGFDLMRPTTATFAEYFSKCILTKYDYEMYNTLWEMENSSRLQRWFANTNQSFTEMCYERSVKDIPSAPFNCYESMLLSMSQIYLQLVDITLQYIEFSNVKPSLVAAACLATTRQVFGIQPVWNTHLIVRTMYTMSEITPIVENLWTIYLIEFKKVNIPKSLLANSLLRMNRILYNLPIEQCINFSQNMSQYPTTHHDDMVVRVDEHNDENENNAASTIRNALKRRRLL